MTEIPSWHPHATWRGFKANADGSSAVFAARDVQRVLEELACISVGRLRIAGVEQSDEGGLSRCVRCAVRAGLAVEVKLRGAIPERMLGLLREAGATLVSVPVEGPDADSHDRFRSIPGEYERLEAFAALARSMDMGLEIRTTLHGGLATRMTAMTQSVCSWRPLRWVIRASPQPDPNMRGSAVEHAIAELASQAPRAGCPVVTHYAPFFLRFCDEREVSPPCRARDERNGLCILPSGTVTPDPAIPLALGDVRYCRLSQVFDDHPVLRALRDPDAVEGKCGRCKFRTMCGGSRARALAQSRNLFASDPACSYGA